MVSLPTLSKRYLNNTDILHLTIVHMVRAPLANTAVRVANRPKKAREGGDAGMQSIFWDAK